MVVRAVMTMSVLMEAGRRKRRQGVQYVYVLRVLPRLCVFRCADLYAGCEVIAVGMVDPVLSDSPEV